MPAPGEKDAQGYQWNGMAWVDPKTGFVKGSEDDKLQKRSTFEKLTSASTWKPLLKAETWADPTGGSTQGGLGVLGFLNETFNPVSSFGKSAQDIREGNWRGALWNAGMGGLQTLGAAQGLGGALTATRLGAVAPASRGAGMFLNLERGLAGTSGLGKAKAYWSGINPSLGGKLLSGVGALGVGAGIAGAIAGPQQAGQTSPIYTGPIIKENWNQAVPGAVPTGTSGTGADQNYLDWRDLLISQGQTPAEAERVAKMFVGMTTLQWTPEQRAQLEKYRASQVAGATTTTPATTAKPGLLPLTPEQISWSGEQMTAAERAYKDLLNEAKLAEKTGRQQYTQAVQGLQRQAAGTAADLAPQLSASGMDISPAAAFGAEQVTQAPLVTGSQTARKSLDQLLSDLEQKRRQAKTMRDTTITGIKSAQKKWQIDNTLASQNRAYGNMVGR